MERKILVDWSKQSKCTTFKGGPRYTVSGQTEPKWTVPFDF